MCKCPFFTVHSRTVLLRNLMHNKMASWLQNNVQERSDNVKSLMALPNTGLSRPPRSPSISKSTILTDSEARTHSGELCSSAQGPQQLQQAVRQVGGRFDSTAERDQHPPGSSGRQDGASNGSSESSELENREVLRRPLQKKGAPVLRRVQSKCENKYTSL